METVYHTLEPVFDEHSKILILGSIPSPFSRKIGFYYGHPQNRFWRIMGEIFHTDIPSSPEGKRDFLLSKRIALWDVLASCNIVGASDSSIKNAVCNDFSVIFSQSPIQKVFTTGKTAFSLYKKFTGQEPALLPSPSPANCAVPFEKLVEAYSVIKSYLE